MSPRGYAATLYFDNFTKYFYITSSSQVNSLLYPALSIFSSYINRIAVSHAYYSNYSLASIWISGYISPSSIDAAAAGKGINVTKYKNVSVMNFGNGTTLCSWYSGGWTKTLVSMYGKNCTAYMANTTNEFNYSNLYFDLKNRNMSLLNYSGYAPNLTYAGDISVNSNAIVFESIMKGANFSNTCSGNIFNLSNNSYCVQTLYQGNETMNQIDPQRREPRAPQVPVVSASKVRDKSLPPTLEAYPRAQPCASSIQRTYPPFTQVTPKAHAFWRFSVCAVRDCSS